jgi:hypothetical protein
VTRVLCVRLAHFQDRSPETGLKYWARRSQLTRHRTCDCEVTQTCESASGADSGSKKLPGLEWITKLPITYRTSIGRTAHKS